MAGVVTSGSFAKALWPGVKKWFQMDYDSWPEEYSQIFDMDSSDKQFEETVGVSEFGFATVKEEGQGIGYDDTEQNFVNRFTHKVYGKGFIITREMYEDDQYGVAGKRGARSLSRSLRITKETNGANILNRAFDSNYTMGTQSDGKELLATDHPLGPYGGTFANELSTPADLSEASLEDLLILISGFVDARGLAIQAMGRCLIVPRQLQFVAARILDSELRPGTADNDINAIRQGNYLPDGTVVNHYLTDSDAWFVKTNVPEGLVCYQRRKMEFAPDNDFDTENAKFKATERYSLGWSDPRGIAGSAGA